MFQPDDVTYLQTTDHIVRCYSDWLFWTCSRFWLSRDVTSCHVMSRVMSRDQCNVIVCIFNYEMVLYVSYFYYHYYYYYYLFFFIAITIVPLYHFTMYHVPCTIVPLVCEVVDYGSQPLAHRDDCDYACVLL